MRRRRLGEGYRLSQLGVDDDTVDGNQKSGKLTHSLTENEVKVVSLSDLPLFTGFDGTSQLVGEPSTAVIVKIPFE